MRRAIIIFSLSVLAACDTQEQADAMRAAAQSKATFECAVRYGLEPGHPKWELCHTRVTADEIQLLVEKRNAEIQRTVAALSEISNAVNPQPRSHTQCRQTGITVNCTTY